ncbi:MAG: hypothetical protein AAB706_03305 [Patescibacteria group bacterium]
MDQSQKKIGVGPFIIAGIVDGLQFLVNFLIFIPFIGIIIAALISFAITLGTFLIFGIFFGYWFPVTFFGEMIPIINGLPFWTARVLYQATKERVPTVTNLGVKK